MLKFTHDHATSSSLFIYKLTVYYVAICMLRMLIGHCLATKVFVGKCQLSGEGREGHEPTIRP